MGPGWPGLDAGMKCLSEINMVMAAPPALHPDPRAGAQGPDRAPGGMVARVATVLRLANPFGRDAANFVQGWTALY